MHSLLQLLATIGVATNSHSTANPQQLQWQVTSYNSQSLRRARSLDIILQELRNSHIIGIQGTGTTLQQASFGQAACVSSSSSGYYTWHWPTGQADGLNKACSVLIACSKRRFSRNSLQTIFTPPSEFQGHVGGLRLRKNGLYDLSPFVLYMPQLSADRQHNDYIRRLLQWLSNTLATLPRRTTPILLLDRNGHFGLEKRDGAWQIMEEGDAVGPFNPSPENQNGKRIRELCNYLDLALANTHQHSGAGDTWFGPAGRSTRVDFIAVPKTLMPSIRSCLVYYRSGHLPSTC
mmetsp:Transcript_90434/g.163089  ORF Transcript_90434/g.163089 Transcript_90434/m.163089 type:complete len:291 (-) Transcript_90434:1400-2272(-)